MSKRKENADKLRRFNDELDELNFSLATLLLRQVNEGPRDSDPANPVISSAVNFLKFHGRRVDPLLDDPCDPGAVFALCDDEDDE